MHFFDVDFVLIEPCNFLDSPAGGQLNFARLLLAAYGGAIATVGEAESPNEPVGRWFKKTTNGIARDHFNLIYRPSSRESIWFPRRLSALFEYRRHRIAIHAHPCKRYFIQEHAILIAFERTYANDVCYRFPGVESQLGKSRFGWAVYLTRVFDFLFYRSTVKADVLLASADHKAIREMLTKSFGYLKRRTILQFPTRVDTSIFCVKKRNTLHSPLRIVSCGRLHWVKGWALMLDALVLLKDCHDFVYTYIGDGPDRVPFLERANRLKLDGCVELTGFLPPNEIAARMRESDLFLMGSVSEGWPTSLVEAYVSGLAMVCTDVSGASDIITNGVNGVIALDRTPEEFCVAIEAALAIDPGTVIDNVIPDRFSINTLRNDLSRLWPTKS